MKQIHILSIGKCKEEWLNIALNEYEKRLTGSIKISWYLVKSDQELEGLLTKKRFIALDPAGKLLDSIEFHKHLYHKFTSPITFVIGGSDGLTPLMKAKASAMISLSPLTFTHQMTRLILLEQIYRSLQIERKTPYHK